ncbi:MAG: cytochrome c oxidase assembly protein [Alphaproteobacteria bacterium]|nr:cytochrome c oxidase assembly protein [Alphaproteobacteria bacterium]
MNNDELTRKNIRAGLILLGVIFGMLALSFASVPLYRLFCQVTGFGGTPNIDPNAKAERVLEQTITIRFNADVAQGMPWEFKAETPSVTLKIGEKGFTSFFARNLTSEPVEGTAIFNVLPEAAGRYFHKTQCFCFGRQSLEGKGEAHMPVAFFIDPAILDDPDLKGVNTLTLSYTMFRADSEALENALQAIYNSGK